MAGLREQKKQQTREAIATAAADLFRDRGFAAVTVDDIAQAVGISRQTVFNYFPSKEQMLFDRDEQIEALLVAAVTGRPPGSSLVDAFRTHTARFWTRIGEQLANGPLPHGFWEIVKDSPHLRDYAEATFSRQARTVGAAIASERGAEPADPVCQAIARALCGVNAAILTHGLDQLIAGDPPAEVVMRALADAERSYDLLASGIDNA
jgi:AcrR family transcriptional regulator